VLCSPVRLRWHRLFANDTANQSRDQSDGTSTPGSSLGSSRSTDSPRNSGGGGGNGGGMGASSSGPFVAGELDPAEIEICRDADGRRIVLGEGAFGRVRTLVFERGMQLRLPVCQKRKRWSNIGEHHGVRITSCTWRFSPCAMCDALSRASAMV